MRVADIMTQPAITIGPDAPVHEAARLMAERGVSGLPVVDDHGDLVGIISDGDLVVRPRPRAHRPWWRLFFADAEQLAREYQKAVGTLVGEVMTRSVVSVAPDLHVAMAALLIDRRGIRRVPVVAGGKVVGIVSRADLVRALAAAPVPGDEAVPDALLVHEMKRRLDREPWVSNRDIGISARDGVVRLSGAAGSRAEKSALETMARTVPGVRGVESDLTVGPARVGEEPGPAQR